MSLAPAPSLFLSNQGCKISLRWVQALFVRWHRAGGFDRVYNFDALRHTAMTNLYRATGDARPLPRAAVREAHEPAHDAGVYACIDEEM